MLISEHARMFYLAGLLTEQEAKDYDEFFKDAAQKFGLDPENIDDEPDEKKKEFYDYIEKNWNAEDEAGEDGEID